MSTIPALCCNNKILIHGDKINIPLLHRLTLHDILLAIDGTQTDTMMASIH